MEMESLEEIFAQCRVEEEKYYQLRARDAHELPSAKHDSIPGTAPNTFIPDMASLNGLAEDGGGLYDFEAAAQVRQEKKGERTPAEDRAAMQMYLLRRKYGSVQEECAYESRAEGLIEQSSSFSADVLNAMGEGTQYLYAKGELTKGAMTDGAQQALALLCRAEDPVLRGFLPAYASVQQQASKQRLRRLLSALPSNASGLEADDYMLYAAQSTVEYAINVTEYADHLQEQGLRNRQEALDIAQRMADGRLSEAERKLSRLRQLR